ncbi:MAG: aspartate carbamoyltransferase [Candidatus Nanoarchaeia archaeon]
MSERNVFQGRTLASSRDLSYDERFYLFEKTRQLKEKFLKGESVDEFKLRKELGLYLCFFEPSTRTKESFKNAAKFLNFSVNSLNSETSSVTKHESYYNTVKTLVGYNNTIFIVRSKVEGLCTWLDESMQSFAEKHGFSKSSFVNAGDGKHEHPTQEELDQFTFLEQLNWDSGKIHIALVGDLFHGRTVHSKTYGLANFDDVKVDLIAPDVLQMPEHYINVMKEKGFKVRKFNSLDEYYNNKDVATIQYFTRLQLERMGEEVLRNEKKLREAVTFREDFIELVPEGTKLYHPQPFDKTKPTIPLSISDTELNGYDNQSMNGFFWRVTLLNALAGNIGEDFNGCSLEKREFSDNFIEEITSTGKGKPDPKVGIRPVSNGVVVDHICKGESPRDIWKHLHLVLKIINMEDTGFCGVGTSGDGKNKGLLVLPDREELDEKVVKRLAAVTPNCTYNIIRDNQVEKKYRLHMPPRIYGFEEVSCKNPNCISREEYAEGAVPEFHGEKGVFVCKYCDTGHSYREIWKIQQKIL